MDDEVQKVPVLKLTGRGATGIEDIVARESSLTVMLNDQDVVTLLCSPADLKYLAVGFLFSEGLLKSKDDIKEITVDDRRGVVRVETGADEQLANEELFKRFITSGCGKGTSFYGADGQGRRKVESTTRISASRLSALAGEFQHRSQIYRATGGVHSAALCDSGNIVLFSEDIGRHNALDKVFGRCVLDGVPTDGRIIITSGRVSSEIVLKVAGRNVPIIASKSAPTDLGVKLADNLGVTLVGFVRGKRMNVYTHAGRISEAPSCHSERSEAE
jgi:FdhD protein